MDSFFDAIEVFFVKLKKLNETIELLENDSLIKLFKESSKVKIFF